MGRREKGRIEIREVYRSPNGVREQDGHLVWDMDTLVAEVKKGIRAAKAEFPGIASLSINTWGVDYVLLREDEEVPPVYTYRDSRTETVISRVHELLPFSLLYRRIGCQFQPFNSIYQLYADKLSGRLEGVTDMLMLPEYLPWMLCGTNAIGEATARKMVDFRLVVWAMHGIYGAGRTMDEAFGLIETVEKAAQIYMLTAGLPRMNTITDEQLRSWQSILA